MVTSEFGTFYHSERCSVRKTPLVRRLSFGGAGDRLLIVPALERAGERQEECAKSLSNSDVGLQSRKVRFRHCGERSEKAVVSLDGTRIVTHSITDRKLRVWDAHRGLFEPPRKIRGM